MEFTPREAKEVLAAIAKGNKEAQERGDQEKIEASAVTPESSKTIASEDRCVIGR